MRAKTVVPLPGAGLDRQRPADQGHPLPHPQQPQPAPGAAGAGASASKPPPSSSTTAEHVPGGALEDDAHAAAPGVLEDVRQRLLDDPVQGRLDAGGRRPPSSPGSGSPTSTPDCSRPLLGVVRQGRVQAEVVQGRGAQLQGELVDLRPDQVGQSPGAAGAGPAPADGSGSRPCQAFSPRPRAVRCWPIWSCSSRAIRRRSSSWAVASRCWKLRRAASARLRRGDLVRQRLVRRGPVRRSALARAPPAGRAPPERLLGPLAVGDVADVALDDLAVAHLVDVADELHLDAAGRPWSAAADPRSGCSPALAASGRRPCSPRCPGTGRSPTAPCPPTRRGE